ncbi:MAG TPA: hypothetical protein VGM90_05575 [Kofleriaceae bacterium]|jgi:predicted small lipoprotein YifL
MKRALLLFALVPAFAACGSDGPPSFTTYDACFDKQPQADMPVDKIFECCTNATVDGNKTPCGASSTDCVNYLTDNLAQQKASTVEIMDACSMYQDKLDADNSH